MFDSRWDWLYVLPGYLWILQGPGVQASVISSIITLILQGLDRTLVSEILIRMFPKLWKFYLHLTKSVIYIATRRLHEEPVASCSFPRLLAYTVAGHRWRWCSLLQCALVAGEADALSFGTQSVYSSTECFCICVKSQGEKKSSWLE